jgi:hypothetical protein
MTLKEFTMKKIMLAGLATMIASQLFAQDTTVVKKSVAFSGYIEPYFIYDANRPLNNTRPGFIYSHNRANEATINLALLKASYTADNVRANLALAAGTYMNANLAAEPGVLKNIYEANAGIKISKKNDLWIDAGIMPSHIGFESATGKDNRTLTRSLAAENSPYYEAGVKLGYTSKSSKWYLAAMYLNGWQRIQRPDGNSTPAFGTQVTYKPNGRLTLNYSTFIGNDKPDSVRQMRYFNNFYLTAQLSNKFGLTTGFDYGMEQKFKGSSSMNNWYTPVIILRFTPDKKNAVALRAEYYNDESGVIVATGTTNGFKTFGVSMNYDRTVSDNVLWRIEARNFSSKDDIFAKRNLSLTNNNFFIATSFCVGF